MVDSQTDTGSSAGSKFSRRWVGVAAGSVVLLALLGGGAAYWQFADRGDEDPGLTGCQSAGVLVRAGQGKVVPAEEVQRVGALFERSAHDDLKSAGVTAAGLVERVQDARNTGPGGDFYRAQLAQAVPRITAACETHQVRVKA